MKKLPALFMALCLPLLAACGANGGMSASNSPAPVKGSELHVFAAASLTETLDQITALYADEAPDVTIIPTYDSSGTLLTQIQEGADCDLFLSASPKQINALEEAGSLAENSRLNLLENKVVLAVPEGNPGAVESFEQLAERLNSGHVLLAVGNSDVPVGQYTQKILACYGLDEAALADSGVLTYGSNVKEVTTQISEATVDCGVIYATDAFSAGLDIVDEATAEMCGQVIYPAAVLNSSAHLEAARAFLDFLSSNTARAVFESVGFTVLE